MITNNQMFNRIAFVFPILSYSIQTFKELTKIRIINHTCNEVFNDETYLILWNNSLTKDDIYELSVRAIFPYLYKVIKCTLFGNPLPLINNEIKAYHCKFDSLMKQGRYFYNDSGFEELISETNKINNNKSTNLEKFFNQLFILEQQLIDHILFNELENNGTTSFNNMAKLFPERYVRIVADSLKERLEQYKLLEQAIETRTLELLPVFNNFPKLLENITKEGLISSSFPIPQSTRTQIIRGVYKSHCPSFSKTLKAVCERLYELFEKSDRRTYKQLKSILFDNISI
jgi:hypothetical protein